MTREEKKKKIDAIYKSKVILESINETKENYNLSIRDMFLNHISQSDGFDINDLGTQYLASLMTMLYHERRLYYTARDTSYFDLNDENNKHYSMFGINSKTFIDEINKSIEKNPKDDGPIDELVYDVVNYFIYRYGMDADNDNQKRYGLNK